MIQNVSTVATEHQNDPNRFSQDPLFENRERRKDPLIAEGKRLFSSASAGCSGCHATESVVNKGTPGRDGPNLTHVASRTQLAGGVFENLDEDGKVNDAILQRNLRAWIEDPEAAKTGNIMARRGVPYTDPANALTEAELSALVAYVSSLK